MAFLAVTLSNGLSMLWALISRRIQDAHISDPLVSRPVRIPRGQLPVAYEALSREG
jgi:hypothetical protein